MPTAKTAAALTSPPTETHPACAAFATPLPGLGRHVADPARPDAFLEEGQGDEEVRVLDPQPSCATMPLQAVHITRN